ncbi:MAG: hypothetical protein V1922_00090 [bacterium]
MSEHARFADVQQLIAENGLFSRHVSEAWHHVPKTLVLTHPYVTIPAFDKGISGTVRGYANTPFFRPDIRDLIASAQSQGVAVVAFEWGDIMDTYPTPVSDFPDLQNAVDLSVPERSVRPAFTCEFQDYVAGQTGHAVDLNSAYRLLSAKPVEIVFARYPGQRVYILNDETRMKAVQLPAGLVQGTVLKRGLKDIPFTQGLTASMLTNPRLPSNDRNRTDPTVLKTAILAEETKVSNRIALEMEQVRQEVAAFFAD